MEKKSYIFKSLKKRERKRDLVKNKWGYNIMFPKVEKKTVFKKGNAEEECYVTKS